MTQLGFENIKILSVALEYNQNKLIVLDTLPENNVADVTGFIEESVKKSNIKEEVKTVQPVVKKPVVVQPKKKKRAPEGGC